MSVFMNGTALPRSPLDSFLLLRGVFPPVDEVAISQSHDRGGLLAGCAYLQSFANGPPSAPPEVTRPVNPQGHQCGDLGGRTFALAPSPDPTMVISLTPSSHSHSFGASSLRRQVRHVRGHCAPLQQLVRDLSTRRTQYVRSSGSLLRLGNQRSRPWLRRRDRGTRDAGHSGLRSSAPSRPRDATLQPLAGHARIHPHIGIQPVALGVLIAEDHQELM